MIRNIRHLFFIYNVFSFFLKKSKVHNNIIILFIVFFSTPIKAETKNIIYMIGDGMGVSYLSAFRYYNDDPNTVEVEDTVFDDIWVGMVSTYPRKLYHITDSAAGGTALATGEKTLNGFVGMNSDQQPLESILSLASNKGFKTGMIVTSSVTGATPASFLTSNISRKNKHQIAKNYITDISMEKNKFDLLLGGGKKYFYQNGNELIDNAIQKKIYYVDKFEKLKNSTKLPVLGLFADEGLPFYIDHRTPDLPMMTEYALEKLKNPSGFVLVIESSQIDWCGHANDIVCAMNEMKEFSDTVKLVKKFVDNNKDTLLVITADHSTGGLSIGAKRRNIWNPSLIKKMKTSVSNLTELLINNNNIEKIWNEKVGFPLDENIKKEIGEKKINGRYILEEYLIELINSLTNTGWTTKNHTGEDVPLLAYGSGSLHFSKCLDNTQIALRFKKIISERKNK
ncbi:alkaline phosphatase [Xenorhabdus sp. Vera]|uniref:alkaline phosphatase n=1 Tax=Xenorhabdus koppenhoeferi TaxID=351659 RepID=UPI0019CA14C8|nr:alkaline phosphatase [Xenorhabdus sp. Vera]MBD2809858.1 alkaline phosphatase [Xenorhabdus sp. Vera]